MSDLADALRSILSARDVLDPQDSVPVYDLHYEDGNHTNYCLVNAEWLDELFTKAEGENAFMPHEHLGDET